MTITKEQFDALKVGDELKNDRYNILVEAKFPTTIVAMFNEYDSAFFSFKFLQLEGYSITQPTEHNCGFPNGDYEDREVVVKVSNESIEDCNIKLLYTRLKSVSEKGFKDCIGSTWRYAVLVTNNVDLVK